MLNKHKIIWGGYKNTTIPKMLREEYDPERYRSGGGSYSVKLTSLYLFN